MTSCSLTSVFGRLLLLIVNLVTGLAGLAFMFIGINGRDPSASSRNIDWSATNVALIGGAILLLSLLGIFASLLNWNLLLKGYAVILLIHVLLVTALYLYVAIFFTASVMDLAQQYFESLMVAFNEDSRAHLIVEIIQKTLLCCGSLAPADWHNVTTGNLSNNQLPTGYYPASCCNGQSGFFNNFSSSLCLEKDLLFTSGCFSPVQISRYVHSLTAYYLVVLTGLLLLAFIACCVERDGQLNSAKQVNRQFAAHMETCRSTRGRIWRYATLGGGNPAAKESPRAFF